MTANVLLTHPRASPRSPDTRPEWPWPPGRMSPKIVDPTPEVSGLRGEAHPQDCGAPALPGVDAISTAATTASTFTNRSSGRAGGHTVDIWQADVPGEPVRVTVVDEHRTELLTVDIEHAAALGALLSAAAIATR